MSKVSRRSFGYAAIALGVVLFVAVNMIANVWLRTARVDLTETGLYTVSQGTKATLAKLTEPITLRFFFSREAAQGYPGVVAYAARIRDLLEEYQALGKGKVRVEEIDPKPFTPEEDQAVQLGLTGAPTQNGDTVYFGLVGTNAENGQEVIPFFDQDRGQYLEYDITSLIYKLSTPVKPKLGLMTSLPLAQGPGGVLASLQGHAQPYAIYSQLKDRFDLQTIDTKVDRIPKDISTLLIVHPADLSQRTLYAIDQFVMRGGHAIVMVDPLSEIAAAQAGQTFKGPTIDTTSDLGPLLKAWGVDYDPTKVVGDVQLAQRVRFGSQNNPQTMDYVVWMKLGPANFDKNDPVTANLNDINIATAGALKPEAGASTKFSPLLTTTTNAGLIDAGLVQATRNPSALIKNFKPAGGSFALAARISGPAKTAFPGGEPPPQPTPDGAKAPPKPAPLPKQITQAKDINVIVVADTDLLDDRFWVNVQNVLGHQVLVPMADNGAFITNAVENMMGSNDLISLRTRATTPRTFTVVDQLRRRAQNRFQAEENQLQQKLQQTQASLRALEGKSQGPNGAENAVLTPQQQTAINNFRQQLIQTRTSLRAVQANLRRDVENLGAWLTFINIALVPILVAFAAIGLALIRRRRRLQARGI